MFGAGIYRSDRHPAAGSPSPKDQSVSLKKAEVNGEWCQGGAQLGRRPCELQSLPG